MPNLPGVTVNVLDGNLNLQPGSTSKIMLYMGVCTLGVPNVLQTIGDGATLQTQCGLGRLVEMGSYGLDTSGGPAQFLPLTVGTPGGVSAVTKLGTGGTMTISVAPHVSITIQCTTGGTLGTAAFTFSLNGGTPSAPVVSAAGWSSTGYMVLGTFCTIVFTAGTYVAGGTPDIYTISTAGAVAHPQGAGPAVPTFTASPIDDYAAVVTITTAGALGTAQFTYSLDGTAASASSPIVSAGSGIYAIPNSGIVITLASAQVAGDTFSFTTCGPNASSGNLTTGLTALQTTYLSSALYSMINLVDGNALSSAWATQSAALQTGMTTLFNSGVYVRVFNQCPTSGSISASAGAVVVNSTDTDATVAANAAAVNADRVAGSAGDVSLTSVITGLAQRRCCSWVAAARAASVAAATNIGEVALGGVPGVNSLYRDETSTPLLDAARFITMRTFPGSVAAGTGVPGFFLTDGKTMALVTSDFSDLCNARVIDRACTIARVNALPYTNGKIPTTTRNGLVGVITEKKAQQIEKKIGSAMTTGLVDIQPQDAVACGVTINRTNNILSSKNLQLTVGAQPFAYSKYITINIGLVAQV